MKCWLTIFTYSSWFTVPRISSRWQKWLFLLCYLYWNSWYEIKLRFTVDVGTSLPKACYRCPFNKRTVLNWFLCAINARNLSWAGVEHEGHREWVQSLWEPVSRKRRMAAPTTALQIDSYHTTRKKQLRLVRRFWHFLRRLIRTRTHGEMVISTATDF